MMAWRLARCGLRRWPPLSRALATMPTPETDRIVSSLLDVAENNGMEAMAPLVKEQELEVLQWLASELSSPKCLSENAMRLSKLDADYTREPCLDLVRGIKLKPGYRVLELGFGGGYAISAMAQRCKEVGARVIGVDVSLQACERTRQALADVGCNSDVVELRCGSVADFFPFEDGTFDAVYHTNCWHFWADLDFSLGETARVLKPRGTLYTGTKLHYLKALFQERFDEVADYFRHIDLKDYEEAIDRAHLRDIHTRFVRLEGSRRSELSGYTLTTAKKPRGWAFKPVRGPSQDCRALPEPGSWPTYPLSYR